MDADVEPEPCRDCGTPVHPGFGWCADCDDRWPDDEDEGCTHCDGDGWSECDDPIQCTSSLCDGQLCPCVACDGSGLASKQWIF